MTPDLADRFAGIALGHVTREYPNKLDHVLAGPDDCAQPPRPAPGLLRQLRLAFLRAWRTGCWRISTGAFPAMPSAAGDPRLVRRASGPRPDRRRVRLPRAAPPRAGSSGHMAGPGCSSWRRNWRCRRRRRDASGRRPLEPLARIFVARFTAFLPLATYPVRAGVHSNTAFAVRLALDYQDEALRPLLTDTARRWYAGDADCQAWEPGGDEFLSPALIEAECMRAALARQGIPSMVRRIPAPGRAATADDAVHAGDGQRPQRRQDRASGRAQSEPGVVLAGAGRLHPRSGGDTADSSDSYRRQPAACQRRIHGRALAVQFRDTGTGVRAPPG